ncbi:RNA-binding protein 12 [Bagarius yarrelli]|uniref:RNA-binding protein 12 n=1 Tax=Bagarius yarrelli TaxID=175774 RepID=A0A556TK57_BAGYA|nr:RNA-binding protein 12 [Bagarius yarrelli]
MAVVIRLQGLPIVAGTMDIRHFFSGLTIPDGGVHIVGGDHGEAFIVFATDEDARLGMMRTGGTIKGSKVSLLLSSKTEMQNMIELSRRRFETGNADGTSVNSSRSGPSNITGGTDRGTLQNTAQAFTNNTSTTVTTAVSVNEPVSIKSASTFASTTLGNMPSNFNNFSSPNLNMGSTMTTSMSSLSTVPPPIPPLPTMPTLPPMPPMPGPPPVSTLPPVSTVNPLTSVPPVPSMTHMPHLSALPPFNPGVPPPVGPVAGGLAASGPPLSLGNPNPMFFNAINPLNPLNLQAHLKAALMNAEELHIKVQGLPYNASELEIGDFFHGLGVDSIQILRDNVGRSSGRALVKFFSPQDSFEALKRNGGMMGQRYIEISPASEIQWRDSQGSCAEQLKIGSESEQIRHHRGSATPASPSVRERARSRSPHKQEFCVYLKGLPYEAENKQIFEFFKNLDIVEDSIYIAYGPNGRATGEGFVEFRNEMDYKVALGCHMQYMGSRFIQVHPITKKNMFEKIDSIRRRLQGSQGDHKGGSSEGGKSSRICAHITNIPYNVSKKDVRLFLDGIQLFEDSLKVLVDGNGNGLGQAVVQFKSEEDAHKAERLHRQKLNGRDAFVHLVTFEQMKEVERNPPPQSKRGQKAQNHSLAHAHVQAQAQVQTQAQHAFPGMTGEEFTFLRSAVGNLGNGPPFVNPFAPGNGLAGPPPLPPLGTALGDVSLAIPPPIVGGHLPGPVLEPPGFRPVGNSAPPAFVGTPESLRSMPSFDNGSSRKSAGQNRGGNQGRSTVSSENSRASNTGGAGDPRPTIVKIQNMPFTVTVDEILDFFYGYKVLPGSVCLQFSEKGLPTGEAMVAFDSHDEAMSAVMDLNDRPIGARKVKITMG